MIIPQFQNKLNGSVFLWLNNLFAQKGSGFNNHGSYFYPVPNKINNLYTYGAPYSQFISDFSVSGAVFPTGLYLNNSFVTTGQSGLFGINYEKGQAYFTQQIPSSTTISGNYSVKDFNIVLTDEPEEKILFETQMTLRPKITVRPTGQANDEVSYPVLFIKNNGYKNEPFAFGGTDLTKVNYSLFIFSDSKQQLDAAEGLICDSFATYAPIFNIPEMPYDAYGRLKSGTFNYQEVKLTKTPGDTNTFFVEDANKSKFSQKIYAELKSINPEAHFSMINLTVNVVRNPRSS